MSDREKLVETINGVLTEWCDWSAGDAVADALLAAGWRLVPTEGPDFDAMVERAIVGWYGAKSWAQIQSLGSKRQLEDIREDARRALRAAIGGDHD